MSNKETIREYTDASTKLDTEACANCLTDDFKISGPFPEPLNKEQYMDMLKSAKQGFPDWNFNYGNFQDTSCTVQITGTHSGEFTVPNRSPIPATGNNINLPKETINFTFEGDKISRMNIDSPPNGGLPGILEQIGASPE